MTSMTDVLRSSTSETIVDLDKLSAAIEALADAQRTTTACAAAMAGADTDMGAAVRSDLDCVDICHAAHQVLIRATADRSVLTGLLLAATAACELSAAHCGQHAEHHGHCRLCSEGTTSAAAACRALLAALEA
jgi:hypothetical protein